MDKESDNIGILYDRYIDDLYSYAVHLGFERNTVMDAIHDLFYNLCRNEKQIKEVSNMKSYLFRSLKNRLLNKNRSDGKLIPLSGTSGNDSPFTIKVTAADIMVEEETRKMIKDKVQKMMELLTGREREIFYLRYIHQYDYPEIAELMNITLPSCRKLFHYGMKRIRNTLLLLFYSFC